MFHRFPLGEKLTEKFSMEVLENRLTYFHRNSVHSTYSKLQDLLQRSRLSRIHFSVELNSLAATTTEVWNKSFAKIVVDCRANKLLFFSAEN